MTTARKIGLLAFGAILISVLAAIALEGMMSPSVSSGPAIVQPEVLPAGSYSEDPLTPGSDAPDFVVEGWLNATPPNPGEQGKKLMVLDIWAGWCPACRLTAPGLVESQRKNKDRVTFVSLTNLPRDRVESFATQFSIPFPCGYGAKHADIARFGAYSARWLTADYNPGYEVRPTIYLIAPNGKVLWNDGQARPLHKKASDLIIGELNDAIEKALQTESLFSFAKPPDSCFNLIRVSMRRTV